jgi:hypothetical protein
MAEGLSMIMHANKRHETEALVGCILWKCNEPARAYHGRKEKLAQKILVHVKRKVEKMKSRKFHEY